MAQQSLGGLLLSEERFAESQRLGTKKYTSPEGVRCQLVTLRSMVKTENPEKDGRIRAFPT